MRYSDTLHDWELIHAIWEEYRHLIEPVTPYDFKRRAVIYMGKRNKKLSSTDLRRLRAKARKMKNSTIKTEKALGRELAKQLQWAYNFQ